MRQGDTLTSLISAGPPCQADRRKLFIPKTEMGHSLLSFILHTETNNLWGPWQRLNNETGLTVATMDSLIQSHTCAPHRDLYSAFTANTVYFIQGGSVLITRSFYCILAAVNWHKIPPLWQKKERKKKRWFVNSETELWADKQPESIFMKLLMFRYFEWAVNQVSINVSISKFYHSLWNWWRRKSFCLSLVQESLYWSQHSYRIQDSNGC